MSSLFLYSLILLVSYIKSQVSITIDNIEFGSVSNTYFHYLLVLNVSNLSSSLSSITLTNINDSSDFYDCSCRQSGDSYFCYLNAENKIDSTKVFSISHYNSRRYSSNVTFHFSNETSNVISCSFSLASSEPLYKYYQDSISFSINESSFSYLFLFSILSNITVHFNNNNEKEVLLTCQIENNLIICSFDNSSFTGNGQLTFTFTSLYKELTFPSITCSFDVTQITSITNNLKLSSNTKESITFTLVSSNGSVDNIKNHLYLNQESSDSEPIPLTSISNNNCTVTLETRKKYYLFFDNKQISSLYIVIYHVVEESKTDLDEIHNGELFIKDAMTLTFSPRLNSKDISSIYFNNTKEAVKGVISNNYANGTVVFGIKYETVNSTGEFKLSFIVGSSQFTSSNGIKITKSTDPIPKFVQYIGEPDSHIRVNDNTSCVFFIFDTKDVEVTKKISISMLFPIGGKVYNCTSYPIKFSSSILYGQICNVTATKPGFAIFEYNVYGKKETVPLTFPIAEEVVYSSSSYLTMNLLMSLIVLLLIKI